jgi:hypothetical protein
MAMENQQMLDPGWILRCWTPSLREAVQDLPLARYASRVQAAYTRARDLAEAQTAIIQQARRPSNELNRSITESLNYRSTSLLPWRRQHLTPTNRWSFYLRRHPLCVDDGNLAGVCTYAIWTAVHMECGKPSLVGS